MKTYLKIREKHDFYRYINPAHIISFKHISTPSDESSHWEIALSNGEKLHTEKYEWIDHNDGDFQPQEKD